jgi:hypothetical protein
MVNRSLMTPDSLVVGIPIGPQPSGNSFGLRQRTTAFTTFSTAARWLKADRTGAGCMAKQIELMIPPGCQDKPARLRSRPSQVGGTVAYRVHSQTQATRIWRLGNVICREPPRRRHGTRLLDDRGNGLSATIRVQSRGVTKPGLPTNSPTTRVFPS